MKEVFFFSSVGGKKVKQYAFAHFYRVLQQIVCIVDSEITLESTIDIDFYGLLFGIIRVPKMSKSSQM